MRGSPSSKPENPLLPLPAPDSQNELALPPSSASARKPLQDLPALVGDKELAEIQTGRRRALRVVAFLALSLLVAAGGIFWWRARYPSIPPGIVWSNGRIDAREIDIETKFAGRVAELLVDEGDMVAAGQPVARMDTRDLEAQLRREEALVRQNEHAVLEAQANVGQLQTQTTLAQQQLERTKALLKRGYATQETYDQRKQALEGVLQALESAKARVVQAVHAYNASMQNVELYKVNIADNTLIAPRAGRILYRISEPGEVLPAGGKIFTMIDISYVYMDIYLPTLEAGRVKIGSDARIVLDAYPGLPIKSKVTYVASQAQFTPKSVETKSERDKLMFRVKVQIDPAVLSKYAESVRIGLPGIAYVRIDPETEWPDWLKGQPVQ